MEQDPEKTIVVRTNVVCELYGDFTLNLKLSGIIRAGCTCTIVIYNAYSSIAKLE